MSSKAITFPVIKGTKIRRNAETGVEILNEGRDGYCVVTPGRYGNRHMFADTLAAARALAVVEVEALRDVIAEARAEAERTEADRTLRRQFPTVADILDERERTEAAVAEATAPALERVELIEFGTAEPSGYAYMLSARPGHAVCIPAMPKIEISKRPRERKGRNGFARAGWSVRIGGIEIDRKPTKRAARVRLDEWLVEHLRKINA